MFVCPLYFMQSAHYPLVAQKMRLFSATTNHFLRKCAHPSAAEKHSPPPRRRRPKSSLQHFGRHRTPTNVGAEQVDKWLRSPFFKRLGFSFADQTFVASVRGMGQGNGWRGRSVHGYCPVQAGQIQRRPTTKRIWARLVVSVTSQNTETLLTHPDAPHISTHVISTIHLEPRQVQTIEETQETSTARPRWFVWNTYHCWALCCVKTAPEYLLSLKQLFTSHQFPFSVKLTRTCGATWAVGVTRNVSSLDPPPHAEWPSQAPQMELSTLERPPGSVFVGETLNVSSIELIYGFAPTAPSSD